jgi:hypothetical protein
MRDFSKVSGDDHDDYCQSHLNPNDWRCAAFRLFPKTLPVGVSANSNAADQRRFQNQNTPITGLPETGDVTHTQPGCGQTGGNGYCSARQCDSRESAQNHGASLPIGYGYNNGE